MAWITTTTTTDADAIHDNVSAEISAITEKTTPVSADLVLIEDSAASNAKKRLQIGNLPSGGGGGSGGGTALIEGFGEDNLAASLTNSQLYRNIQGIEAQLPVVMSRAGSIVGLSVASSEARTAGTATFEVYKDGTATGLTAVLNAIDTQYVDASQAASLDTFVAGNRLDVRVTTDGSWAPATADVEAVITITDGSLAVPQWINFLAARQPGETAHAYDDFFDDDDDTPWTDIQISGTLVSTEKYGLMSLKSSGDTASDLNGVLKPLDSLTSPLTIETAVKYQGSVGTGAGEIGIGFTDGTTGASGLAACRGWAAAALMGFIGGTLTNFDSTWTNYMTRGEAGQTGLQYMRCIWKSANTFRIMISPDGVSWDDIAAADLTRTLTPTHFGVFCSNYGQADAAIASYEYFRVTESDLSA